MIDFSNMTQDEFIRMNEENLPPQLFKYLDALNEKITSLENDVRILERNYELSEEQCSFARNLIEELENFSDNELRGVKKKAFDRILADTQFET